MGWRRRRRRRRKGLFSIFQSPSSPPFPLHTRLVCRRLKNSKFRPKRREKGCRHSRHCPSPSFFLSNGVGGRKRGGKREEEDEDSEKPFLLLLLSPQKPTHFPFLPHSGQKIPPPPPPQFLSSHPSYLLLLCIHLDSGILTLPSLPPLSPPHAIYQAKSLLIGSQERRGQFPLKLHLR